MVRGIPVAVAVVLQLAHEVCVEGHQFDEASVILCSRSSGATNTRQQSHSADRVAGNLI